MSDVMRVIGRDFASLLKGFGAYLVLILGYVGIVATGCLVAHLILGSSEAGIEQFFAIMNLEFAELLNKIRYPLVYLNWIVLLVVILWMLRAGTTQYIDNIRDQIRLMKLRESKRLSHNAIVFEHNNNLQKDYKKAANGS